MTAGEILEKYWGYTSFRPMQEEIVNAAVEGRDLLAIMPTGGGKSICFQVPALMRAGIAIVVTPLIALMKDQVQNLEARGIKALCIHAGMDRHQIRLALNNAAYGDFKFLYVSPERLKTGLFKSYLEFMEVSYIVVDEAHCISQWGYDFRPDYLEVGELRKTVDAPLIALTATATERVAKDIMERLSRDGKGGGMTLMRSGFERPNLSYIARNCEDKTGQLINICRSVPGSGIVYMRHRRKCEEMAALLTSQGINASFYHAGLGGRERGRRQQMWKKGETSVMVCTNAFGMGIDKPDVRFVVHLEPADCLEAYFQEAGRAGRDGLRSYAVLLWNAADAARLRQLLASSFPSLEYIADIYQKIHIFNGIPYDNGEGWHIRFDEEAFVKHYRLNRAQMFHAIKYLERSGHLSYCEDVDTPTQIGIRVERNELYSTELSDPQMIPLLETLMRRYTGIFSYTVPVDDEDIASALGIPVPELHQLFYRMSLEHVVKYIPASHSSIIILNHNRLAPGNVDLQEEKYVFLRKTAEERCEAMIEYASQNELCRSRFLLKYFGQEKSENCGCCDICKSARGDEPARKAIEEFLKSHPGAGPEEIRAWCDNPKRGLDPARALRILRELMD